jgi:5'-nucleotidase
VLILVTNDDGVDAAGLSADAEAMAALGEVFVVAPDGNRSANSHALTLERPLRATELKPNWFSCDGTPADCVHLALNGLLRDRRPDLVLSGFNQGGNLGQDITYSGTVMAAFEATLIGVPALAASVDARGDFEFSGVAWAATVVAREVLAHGLPRATLLNMNAPSLPPARLKGIRLTTQGQRVYGDEIQERVDPRGKKYYWIAGQELGFEPIAGSDMVAVREGYVSLTPLSCDMTDHKFLREMAGRSWTGTT